MRYYGDIPIQHLELVKELEILEDWFNENGDGVPPKAAAKGAVCMAHDYFSMEMEEEADRLLIMAEKQYPGYFKKQIHDDALKDKDFNTLVENLKRSIGLGTMKLLGFEE